MKLFIEYRHLDIGPKLFVAVGVYFNDVPVWILAEADLLARTREELGYFGSLFPSTCCNSFCQLFYLLLGNGNMEKSSSPVFKISISLSALSFRFDELKKLDAYSISGAQMTNEKLAEL
jgi:hypothetical protein